MAVAFLVCLAVFVVHRVIHSAGVALTCFTPSSQAVCDHLGLFGLGLHFVVENECTGADNLNTTKTLEYTKDRYNMKIRNERVSPKGPTNNLRRPKDEMKKK
jgi:hypothetical protein